MRKVPPSDVLREEINRSLTGGVEDGTDLLSHLVHLGLGYLVQQALEQEQEDFLGRGHYERRGEDIGDRPARYRNGYEQGRLRTAEGGGQCESTAGQGRLNSLPLQAHGVPKRPL